MLPGVGSETQDLLEQDEIQYRDFAATEDFSSDQDDDDDVCDDLSLYAKGNTSEDPDVSASDPAPVVLHTTRRIFVIGESHLKPAHFCNLKALLEAAGAEVAMYEAIGGGTFTDTRFTNAVERAINEVRKDDVILIMMGSNDARNIAREQPDANKNISTILQNMAMTASEKKCHLIVVSPLPSPCYERPWCPTPAGDTCEHEQRYHTAQVSVRNTMKSALGISPTYAHFISTGTGKFKKLLTKTGQVARKYFRKGDIHINSYYGAEIL